MEKLKKEKKTKNQNGITLIALLITVIVLIILATITISMLTDETSVTDKTAEVKTESDYNAYEEQIKLSVIESYNYDKSNDNIDLEKLNKAINEKLKLEDDEKVNITELPAYIKIKNVWFSILENGDVKRNSRGSYQEVEYIESTGEQLIDLNIVPKKDLNIEITMTPIEKTANMYIGAAYSDQTDYRFFYTGNTLYFDIANQRLGVDQSETSILDQKITFNLGNYYIKKDNVQIATKTAVTKEPAQGKSIYVFGGYFSSFKKCAKMKLYSLKIWDNNMLVRDMIPCYKKADGEVGMYDIVSDSFFENKGTGTFEKGEDIK